MLAVDVYNKPATSFKSGAYIVLMVIAWTSLLHAIFERRKTPYFYRNPQRFKLLCHKQSVDWSGYRLTLDTEDD